MNNTFLSLRGTQRKSFVDSKYIYYRKFCNTITLLSSIASISYFISDCQLFGRIAYETILPRFSILIMSLIYIIGTHKDLGIKAEMLLSHLTGHSIIWCTIWAIYYLPNKQYASDGFMILQLVILMIGFASSFEIASLSQLMVVGDIVISYTFNKYEDILIILVLIIPCTLGIIIAHYMFNKLYYDTYKVSLKLENLSYVDQLTGVYNRHKLDELTTDNRLNYVRLQDISIIILDIDFFKKVNDTYGHDKGDIVLKEVAKVLTKTLRNDDVVIRWGGEEFLILLYNCTEREATAVAEKIRKSIEEHDNGVAKVTVSLGVCEYNGANYKETVNNADKALYKAKYTGRNKTVPYSAIKNNK